MGFGAKLKELRVNKGMSVRELAAEIGMDYTLLSKIENGLRPAPEIHYIFALADVLEMEDPDELREFTRLAIEPQDEVGERLTEEQLERFRKSESLKVFMRLKPDRKGKGE